MGDIDWVGDTYGVCRYGREGILDGWVGGYGWGWAKWHIF